MHGKSNAIAIAERVKSRMINLENILFIEQFLHQMIIIETYLYYGNLNIDVTLMNFREEIFSKYATHFLPRCYLESYSHAYSQLCFFFFVNSSTFSYFSLPFKMSHEINESIFGTFNIFSFFNYPIYARRTCRR